MDGEGNVLITPDLDIKYRVNWGEGEPGKTALTKYAFFEWADSAAAFCVSFWDHDDGGARWEPKCPYIFWEFDPTGQSKDSMDGFWKIVEDKSGFNLKK